jgi:1-deoxy-D-xylulose-5-phosphate synthase
MTKKTTPVEVRTSSFLEQVNSPADLRKLSVEELESLCAELREYLWKTITQQGGHLAASLGVVELTVALHYVYDAPKDKIIWDVGHQSYVHKILTGRKKEFSAIRELGGISGFPRRDESEFDAFGTGHASTSISAALGMAVARDLRGEAHKVLAVIGDGGMTGGLAFEGLNNAGASGRDITVILNDNRMSISPNVGAIAKVLARMETNPLLGRVKDEIWNLLGKLPKGASQARELAGRIEGSLKNLLVAGAIFEDLGFQYFGPFDGHNVGHLIEVLQKIQTHRHPVLVHVITQKGKGFDLSEKDPTKYHGVAVASSKINDNGAPPPHSYTEIFSKSILAEAEQNPKIIAITAAMAEGTGLVSFAKRFPERFFDVGIAEGHAVTFAAGLAAEGLRPVCAIYSTFLQRAFDSIVHDVALQKLPVVFAVDRAGIVGEDGPTHHGVFDLTFLSTIPNMIVSAPRNGRELQDLLHTAAEWNDGPFTIRFSRSSIPDEMSDAAPNSIPVGKWEQLRRGRDIAILAVGSMVEIALDAADELAKDGIAVSVVNCRFVKPIDEAMLRAIQFAHPFLITMEENTGIGGFASVIARALAGFPNAPRLLSLHLPDHFIEHGARRKLLEQVGLSKETLKRIVTQLARGRMPVAPDEMETGYAFVTMENGVIRKVRATA